MCINRLLREKHRCAQFLSRVQVYAVSQTAAARLLCPWDSPGKNTAMGSHSLLQVIIPTQGSKSGLLYCRHSLPSEPPGKLYILYKLIINNQL